MLRFSKYFVAIYILAISITAVAFPHDFSHLDPDRKVPAKLLAKALDYYSTNQSRIKNRDVLGIIDFSQHSSRERFFLVDLVTGDVDSYLVAHGKNSDKNFDGIAEVFSNSKDSLMSSVGFYLTGESYFGKKGHSLRLDGLSETNSLARARDIVIHGADYVAFGRGAIGRSWGCPAVEFRYVDEIINRIKGKSLLLVE